MRKLSSWKSMAVLSVSLLIPALSWGHPSSISIAAPHSGQEVVTDALPVTVNVEGTISHSSPGNVNDMPACVSLDGATPECVPAPDGLGSSGSYNYTVPVSIYTTGSHTLQASTYKGSPGDHASSSEVINITVVLTSTICDEVDPPAYANHYLNSNDLPKAFAKYRGKVIRQIANNHADGEYGSCTYAYEDVVNDVEELLRNLGFYE